MPLSAGEWSRTAHSGFGSACSRRTIPTRSCRCSPAACQAQSILGHYCRILIGSIDLRVMFRRAWTITIAGWALVGLPTLCTAGILTHPCEPEESSRPVQHSHNEKEDGCHHEPDCAQDPCSELSVRNDHEDVHSVVSGIFLLAAEFIPPTDSAEHPLPFRALRFACLQFCRLPCPKSVFPLLI